MIHFRKIRWKNLLSTGNVFTEVDLDKFENTLIIGTNGAGKSTLLDALTFALFGKSFRGINIPSLVNTINEKDLIVEVEFRIGTREYKVERGIKPVLFNIYCNGNLINQDAKSKDYQKVLETQILKFNYKAFTQIVILGSSSFVPFMQLPALDRRAIIEDLLDIEIFSSMNGIVKSKIKELVADLAASKVKLDATLAKIDLQKKYVDEAKRNSTELVAKKNTEYNDNEIQVNKLIADAELVQKHIDILLKQVSDEPVVRNKLSQLKSFHTKIETKMKGAQKHLHFYSDNDNCPTCQQSLEINFKNNAINTANTQLYEYKEGIQKLNDKSDQLYVRLGEITDLQEKIRKHQSEVTRINASVVQIQRYLKKLQSEIKELETKKVLSDDMLQVSEQLLKDLAELNSKRVELSDSKKYYDVAATLLKDDGVKTKIIKQYLPVINKLVNKYLSAMDFFVNFEIDEEFKETIKSRHRDTFRYDNFSEGEKMRIDLALLFTWRTIAKLKNSMNTNVLILDEVFDSSLDNTGTEEFMKLLNTLGKEANVFVISHKGDILIDKFPNIIKFEKVKNFSVIT
jgi:DNA repair exonuclease SbcCD ATPase subunit